MLHAAQAKLAIAMVAVAIAVHRKLFSRVMMARIDLKHAFVTLFGKGYMNKNRLHPWLSRVSELEACLCNLSLESVPTSYCDLAHGTWRRSAGRRRRSSSVWSCRYECFSTLHALMSVDDPRASACLWRVVLNLLKTIN